MSRNNIKKPAVPQKTIPELFALSSPRTSKPHKQLEEVPCTSSSRRTRNGDKPSADVMYDIAKQEETQLPISFNDFRKYTNIEEVAVMYLKNHTRHDHLDVKELIENKKKIKCYARLLYVVYCKEPHIRSLRPMKYLKIDDNCPIEICVKIRSTDSKHKSQITPYLFRRERELLEKRVLTTAAVVDLATDDDNIANDDNVQQDTNQHDSVAAPQVPFVTVHADRLPRERFTPLNNSISASIPESITTESEKIKPPVSLKVFQRYINCSEVVIKVLQNHNIQNINKDSKRFQRAIQKFYTDFYTKPWKRAAYDYRIKPCPAHIKSMLLQVPNLNASNAEQAPAVLEGPAPVKRRKIIVEDSAVVGQHSNETNSVTAHAVTLPREGFTSLDKSISASTPVAIPTESPLKSLTNVSTENIKPPISLQIFQRYINCNEVVTTILQKQNIENIQKDSQVFQNALQRFYTDFYTKPWKRAEYDYRIKSCPVYMKSLLLQVPNNAKQAAAGSEESSQEKHQKTIVEDSTIVDQNSNEIDTNDAKAKPAEQELQKTPEQLSSMDSMQSEINSADKIQTPTQQPFNVSLLDFLNFTNLREFAFKVMKSREEHIPLEELLQDNQRHEMYIQHLYKLYFKRDSRLRVSKYFELNFKFSDTCPPELREKILQAPYDDEDNEQLKNTEPMSIPNGLNTQSAAVQDATGEPKTALTQAVGGEGAPMESVSRSILIVQDSLLLKCMNRRKLSEKRKQIKLQRIRAFLANERPVIQSNVVIQQANHAISQYQPQQQLQLATTSLQEKVTKTQQQMPQQELQDEQQQQKPQATELQEHQRQQQEEEECKKVEDQHQRQEDHRITNNLQTSRNLTVQLATSPEQQQQNLQNSQQNSTINSYIESAKRDFFTIVDKRCTLPYVLRASTGLKSQILAAILRMSFEDFSNITCIHQAQSLYDNFSALEPFYNYAIVKEKIWPINLYIPLFKLSIFLMTRVQFEHFDLSIISPKLLHWQDLKTCTDFDECVRYDYRKRCALEIDSEHLLQNMREEYYNRCWTADEWFSRIPAITDLNLLEDIASWQVRMKLYFRKPTQPSKTENIYKELREFVEQAQSGAEEQLEMSNESPETVIANETSMMKESTIEEAYSNPEQKNLTTVESSTTQADYVNTDLDSTLAVSPLQISDITQNQADYVNTDLDSTLAVLPLQINDITQNAKHISITKVVEQAQIGVEEQLEMMFNDRTETVVANETSMMKESTIEEAYVNPEQRNLTTVESSTTQAENGNEQEMNIFDISAVPVISNTQNVTAAITTTLSPHLFARISESSELIPSSGGSDSTHCTLNDNVITITSTPELSPEESLEAAVSVAALSNPCESNNFQRPALAELATTSTADKQLGATATNKNSASKDQQLSIAKPHFSEQDIIKQEKDAAPALNKLLFVQMDNDSFVCIPTKDEIICLEESTTDLQNTLAFESSSSSEAMGLSCSSSGDQNINTFCNAQSLTSSVENDSPAVCEKIQQNAEDRKETIIAIGIMSMSLSSDIIEQQQAGPQQTEHQQSEQSQAKQLQIEELQAEHQQIEQQQADQQQADQQQADQQQADQQQAEQQHTKHQQTEQLQVEPQQTEHQPSEQQQTEQQQLLQAERQRNEQQQMEHQQTGQQLKYIYVTQRKKPQNLQESNTITAVVPQVTHTYRALPIQFKQVGRLTANTTTTKTTVATYINQTPKTGMKRFEIINKGVVTKLPVPQSNCYIRKLIKELTTTTTTTTTTTITTATTNTRNLPSFGSTFTPSQGFSGDSIILNNTELWNVVDKLQEQHQLQQQQQQQPLTQTQTNTIPLSSLTTTAANTNTTTATSSSSSSSDLKNAL